MCEREEKTEMANMANVLGLIFANMHEQSVADLTKQRTLASVPFGGRYRMIDFPLSNMVNSDIDNVGIITKDNYLSLMDHSFKKNRRYAPASPLRKQPRSLQRQT